MSPVLEATRAQRKAAQEELDALLAAIEKREDKTMTDDDDEKFESLAKQIRKLDKQAEKLAESEKRAEKAASAAADHEQAAGVAGVYVGRERMTYEEGDPSASFLRDVAMISANAANFGYVREAEQARERMVRHNHEIEVETRKMSADEYRNFSRFLDSTESTVSKGSEARVTPNTTAGTGGEFVPPLWLVPSYAPFARPGRVIANRIGSMSLPGGIDQINVPVITTGTLTGVQSANNTPVPSRDFVTKSVSAAVNTITGQSDLSLQLIEQSPIDMSQVVFPDLLADYDLQLDTQVIAGSGSNGQHRGVLGLTQATANSTTAFNTDRTKANQVTCASTLFWDGTSATSFTQYRSIVNAVTNIELLRFRSPTAVWGHPRRVNSWALASDAATGRPLYVAANNNPFNALGQQESSPVTEGVAGIVYGLPVVKDPSIPTTCATGAITGGTGDVVAVVKEDDLMLWEGTMRIRALPEVLSGTLTMRYQIYAYSAFLPDRFAASISIITGTTGLAAPSW